MDKRLKLLQNYLVYYDSIAKHAMMNVERIKRQMEQLLRQEPDNLIDTILDNSPESDTESQTDRDKLIREGEAVLAAILYEKLFYPVVEVEEMLRKEDDGTT